MHHCLPQLDHVPEAKSIQNEPILLDNHLFIDDLPSEKKIAISPRLSRVPTSPSPLAAQDCLYGPSGGPRFQKPTRWFQGVAVIGNPHGPLFGNPIRLFLTPLVNGILPLSYFSSDLVPSWHILCQIRLKFIHAHSFWGYHSALHPVSYISSMFHVIHFIQFIQFQWWHHRHGNGYGGRSVFWNSSAATTWTAMAGALFSLGWSQKLDDDIKYVCTYV